jgi:hypothetical protein
VVVVRMSAIETKVGCVMVNGAGGTDVEKVGGGVEGFDPKGRW